MWWAANLLGVLITSTLGERLCLKKELEPIRWCWTKARQAQDQGRRRIERFVGQSNQQQFWDWQGGPSAQATSASGDAWPLQNLWRNDVGSSTLRGSNSGAAHGLVASGQATSPGGGGTDSLALLPSPSAASLTPVGNGSGTGQAVEGTAVGKT
ncbi:hypothetical protein BCR44DRAFT_1423994, partial [Catenaria anguillulae PL171]